MTAPVSIPLTSVTPVTPLRVAPVQNPRIITLDFETVPDALVLERALSASQDIEAARVAAQTGDVDTMKELLGEDFKPGNAKRPEALLAALDKFKESSDAKRIKSLSCDPSALAICSWAVFTMNPERPDERTAAVCSWGSTMDESQVQELEGAPTELQVFQTVDAARGLLEMSPEEQWDAEHLMLLNLWGWLGQYSQDYAQGRVVIATFNGYNFDVPALRWRTMRHRHPIGNLPGVRPTLTLKAERYKCRPHLDLAQESWNWDAARMKGRGLEEVLARCGVTYRKAEVGDGTKMSGDKVHQMACEGRWDLIETYNVGDVVRLHDGATALLEGGIA